MHLIRTAYKAVIGHFYHSYTKYMKKFSTYLRLVLIFTLSACSGDSPQSTSDGPSATPIAGFEVIPMDLSRTVSASGTVETRYISIIGAPFAGIVESVFVEEGDMVEPGDRIALYNMSDIEAEKRRAAAQVNEVQQRLNRLENLYERDAISQSELDDVRAEHSVAVAELDIWETRSELGRLHAVSTGVITQRHVEPGSPVSANQPLFRIEDTNTLIIEVALSELDVIHVNIGDSVEVIFDAYPDQRIIASVRRVFPSAETSSRRFPVEIELPEELSFNVRPGFMARALFDVDQREQTLAVPSEALLASQRNEQFLYKVQADTLVRVDVELGVARRNRTEIRSGLEQGDIIVGTNPTNLNEGTRVRITEWIE